MCKPTIEAETVWYGPFPDETNYYVVVYEPWFFGLLKKKTKLVAVMPHNYHDQAATLKLLRQTYLDDYDDNGKPVWTGSPPSSK